MVQTANIAIGDVLDGKYEIQELLGEGAMGVVYKATHLRLQRSVALKTLRHEYASNTVLLQRFELEARAASAIGHPNIIQVFDAGGGGDSVPYLVMESLSGQSLGDLLRSIGPLSVGRTVSICTQVLAGLEAAHGVGILHRDLKLAVDVVVATARRYGIRFATGDRRATRAAILAAVDVRYFNFGPGNVVQRYRGIIRTLGGLRQQGIITSVRQYLGPLNPW